MHILHCAPLGKSLLQEFIRKIIAAGSKGEAGRIAFILPSPYLLAHARQVLRRVEMTAWESPRIMSLDELADHFCGVRKISRIEQEMIISDLVRNRTDAGLERCFGEIIDFPGFVSALARLFDEIKMAAVTPDELDAAFIALQDDTDRNPERDVAVGELFRAYQERLKFCNVADVAGSYLMAIDTLTESDIPLPFEKIFMSEFSVLSPLRLRLLESLKRKVAMEIGICFEKNRPEVFSAVEPIYQELVGIGFTPIFQKHEHSSKTALSHIRDQLFREQPTLSENAAEVLILRSPNRQKEASVVADKIKQLMLGGGKCPDEFAVIVRDTEQYPQLRTAFAERGVPLALAESLPVSALALSRLIFSWLEMVRTRGERTVSLSVMKSAYIVDRLKWDADNLEKAVLGEVVRDWNDWETAICRQAAGTQVRDSWLQGVLELRQRSMEWEKEWSWQEWAEKIVDLLDWLDVPAALKKRRAAGVLDLQGVRAELSGLQLLLEAADQFRCIEEVLPYTNAKVTASHVGEALRQILQARRIPISESEDVGVQVVTPGTASGMKFSAVFLLGLTEGEFPALPRESWLYGDAERQAMAEVGVLLTTAAEREKTVDFSFSLAVAMAKERLVLSAVVDSERLHSRYLDEIVRLFVEESIAVEQFGPHQVAPDEANHVWSEHELLLGALRHIWQQSPRASEWKQVYGAICEKMPGRMEERAGIEAQRSGKYAGLVDPALISIPQFSPSALEEYAACPFAFFVSNILGLSEWETGTAGMNALVTGAIWHETLAAFLGRYRGKQLTQSQRDRYEKEIKQMLAITVAGLEKQGKIVPDVWWKYEKPLIENAMESWLDAELASQQKLTIVPAFFEWGFGLKSRTGCDPASVANPLILGPAGREVRLQGKIDRIDKTDNGVRVVDYKTGRAPARKQVEQGLRLQIPVYMMAVANLLGAADISGEYLPVGHPFSSVVLPDKKCSLQDLFDATAHYVSEYVAGIRSGAFAPNPAAACPDYCTARNFCRRVGELDGDGVEEFLDE